MSRSNGGRQEGRHVVTPGKKRLSTEEEWYEGEKLAKLASSTRIRGGLTIRLISQACRWVKGFLCSTKLPPETFSSVTFSQPSKILPSIRRLSTLSRRDLGDKF